MYEILMKENFLFEQIVYLKNKIKNKKIVRQESLYICWHFMKDYLWGQKE